MGKWLSDGSLGCMLDAIAMANQDTAPPTRPCKSCQAIIPVDMSFCGLCGAPQDARASSVAPAAAPAVSQPPAPRPEQPAARARLVSTDLSGSEGPTFKLEAQENLCGRQQGAVPLDDPWTSPRHCMFRFVGQDLLVRDEGSINGIHIQVRGTVEIRHGDTLTVGQQVLRFEDEASIPKQHLRRADGDDSPVWGRHVEQMYGRLVELLDNGRTGCVYLLEGWEVRIGRELGDILFPDDPYMSRQHCILSYRPPRVYLADLGSSNGTYLRIRSERHLNHGDVLLVGRRLLRVDMPRTP